ncbi:MAG: sulfatase-like hydrolase/transferase, partial [Opitutaceae bacterium]
VLAMTGNIDWNAGRILRRLDELHLAGNTIVIYFSDNGPNSARWNGGMKGRKTSTDEGGVRSPFAIRWPGHIAPGTRIEQIAGAIDLLPTLAECAGISPGNTKPLDGISLVPLLLQEDVENWPDRMIFSRQKDRVSVRTQRHRLDHSGALYDMIADPGQIRNIVAEEPEIAARLSRAVRMWRKEAISPDFAEGWPFPVGYREFPLTELRAAHGVPHGNIERSSVWPSASYFTNWTDEGDRITWDVKVATPGRYAATVYYACGEADVGSIVELSFGMSRVTATLRTPNDPPLRGAEHDRVPRGAQTYAKEFEPFALGNVDLQAGRGELTLRALRVAGESVMDVQAVALELLP